MVITPNKLFQKRFSSRSFCFTMDGFENIAAVRRRRVLEHERKKRIFNERQRHFGIDREALESQTKEKNDYANLKKYQNDVADQQILHFDRIAQILEHQEIETRNLSDRFLNDFRLSNQKPENRREFDINDPNRLKTEKPVRDVTILDDDFPVSGIQKFLGEDLKAKDREKLQKLQLSHSLEEQITEKTAEAYRVDELQQIQDYELLEIDRQAFDFQKREEALCKQRAYLISNMNIAMAEDQRRLKMEDREREERMNRLDVHTTYYGDFLTENPAVARSAYGPHRILSDRWKGMGPEQISAIRNMQMLQMEEKKGERAQDWRLNNEIENIQITDSHLALLKQKELDQQKWLDNKILEQENILLSRQQMSYQNELEKHYRSNTPTDAFFSQFNTSSR